MVSGKRRLTRTVSRPPESRKTPIRAEGKAADQVRMPVHGGPGDVSTLCRTWCQERGGSPEQLQGHQRAERPPSGLKARQPTKCACQCMVVLAMSVLCAGHGVRKEAAHQNSLETAREQEDPVRAEAEAADRVGMPVHGGLRYVGLLPGPWGSRLGTHHSCGKAVPDVNASSLIASRYALLLGIYGHALWQTGGLCQGCVRFICSSFEAHSLCLLTRCRQQTNLQVIVYGLGNHNCCSCCSCEQMESVMYKGFLS